jgi:peptidoglycan/LPS O-acetylase OafA/YrhL
MLFDLVQLLRRKSKHGPIYWAVWTLIFSALAVAGFMTESHLWGYLWGLLALMGLVGFVVRVSHPHPPPENRSSSSVL